MSPADALPSPPFVTVDGVPNFRDVGGYVCEEQMIRSRLLYRCGDVSRITSEGLRTLQELGIRHVFDLRSSTELKKTSNLSEGEGLEWHGIAKHLVPVFSDVDYSPGRIALRYQNYSSGGIEAYADILKAAPSAFKAISLYLAGETVQPLIVHCTAGKDRTGVFFALLLSVCGCDDETVATEYSYTEIGLAEFREVLVQRLITNPAVGNRDGAINMLGARREAMLATLCMVREKYGSAAEYLKSQCGLTTFEVEQMRRNLRVQI